MILAIAGTGWLAGHWLTKGLTTSKALEALRRSAPRKLDGSVNLLLIGLDSRKDMNGDDLPREFVQEELHAGSSAIGGYNTNTLILMHIPADGGKVTAFSIPRDDYVQVAGGRGEHKIKEAYGLAKAEAQDRLAAQGLKGAELEHRSREAGREATLATVQDFLGVPIDHFAEVNLLGFYDIAKVVQPVPVCLRHAVHDRFSGADFPAGRQELDARQALAFVRQRHGLAGGDLDRTHRQQAFLSSVVHKLASQGAWGDLGKLEGLLDVVKKDVVLDDQWDLLDFARQAPNLTGGNAEFHTLPIAGFATRKGEAVNLVDPVRVRSLVQEMIGHPGHEGRSDNAHPARSASPAAPPTTPPPVPADASSTTVDVHNASGVHGAAAAESRALSALGYTPGHIANAPGGVTSVVHGRGAGAAARQIAARLGVTASPSDTVPARRVVVTLGPGFTPPGPAAPATPHPTATPGADSRVPSDAFQGRSVRMGGITCVD
ncbi:LytR family transcriptional regulator [Streptomyces caatingaensis]|uniref:LytR family transcriptional regulator n=1 Tax=Streptomyces caatingaensis TaxID=1678637 RepID=A0A0K9XG68_9ACTN|nr:LytR family transcriptional regulator [Streptomyces caatingaensis]